MDYNNKKYRDEYAKFLKGKRVVLVGPAPSVIDSNQCDIIDSFDIVVRLNKALPIPKELYKDIGTKTDVLYNCMNPSPECGGVISQSNLNKSGVKFLVSPYPYIDNINDTKLPFKKHINEFTRVMKKDNNFKFCYYNDLKNFTKYWDIMKLPNTGVMAILDLLKHDIKELYITGITFFKGGYYPKYRNYDEKKVLNYMKKFNLHKPEKAFKYMTKKLYEYKFKDGIICKYDKMLDDILIEENTTQDEKKNEKKNEKKETENIENIPILTDEISLDKIELWSSNNVSIFNKNSLIGLVY